MTRRPLVPPFPSAPNAPAIDTRARAIAELSADEIVSAIGLREAPRLLRSGAAFALTAISARMGRVLARFDDRVGALGVARAAALALSDLGATWTKEGEVAADGTILVVANHPGAYDTLVLLAALGRDDVAIVAADRAFLRAMPTFARHLSFLSDDPAARVPALRRALRHLERGGALLHFGAGRIEPDPAFARRGEPLLAEWQPGTAPLVRSAARAGGHVIAAMVDGVHSARAKRLFVTRFAEWRGVTTLPVLLQIAIPAYREVHARVRLATPIEARALLPSGADDAAITELVRSRARSLAPT